MRKLAAMVVMCGVTSLASAWGMWSGANVLARGMAAEESQDLTISPGLCVGAFSKDGCEGVVEPGVFESLSCPLTNCRTIRARNAVYKTTMTSSNLACSSSPACLSRCDEFPDGTLTLKFSFVLRADSCCPYRGSWVGKWEYVTTAGRVFGGEAHGTIGVGTNRKSACNAPNNDECEDCYDVQRMDTGELFIAMEGSFRGQSVNPSSFPVDELNFTSDGTWVISPFVTSPFQQPFRVVNRFDGVHLDYCP